VEDLSDGLTLDSLTQSGPIEGYDPNFDSTVRWFEEYAEFRLPVAVAPDAAQGIYSIAGRVDYMYCNDRVCIPATEPFVYDVEVKGVAETEAIQKATPPGTDETGVPLGAPGSSSSDLMSAPNDLERARSGGL